MLANRFMASNKKGEMLAREKRWRRETVCEIDGEAEGDLANVPRGALNLKTMPTWPPREKRAEERHHAKPRRDESKLRGIPLSILHPDERKTAGLARAFGSSKSIIRWSASSSSQR